MFKWLFIMCTVVVAGQIQGLPKCNRWAWAYVKGDITKALSKLKEQRKGMDKATLQNPKKGEVFLVRTDDDPATYIGKIVEDRFEWCKVNGDTCDKTQSRQSFNEAIIASYPKPSPDFLRGRGAQKDYDAYRESYDAIIKQLQSEGIETDYFYQFGFDALSDSWIREIGIGIEDTKKPDYSLIESRILEHPQAMSVENLLGTLKSLRGFHTPGIERSLWFYNGRDLIEYELTQDKDQKLQLQKKGSFEDWAKATFNVDAPSDYRTNHLFLEFAPLLNMNIAQKIDVLYDFFFNGNGTRDPVPGLHLVKKAGKTMLDPLQESEQVWVSNNGTIRFCNYDNVDKDFDEKNLEPCKSNPYNRRKVLDSVQKELHKDPGLLGIELQDIFDCKQNGTVPLNLVGYPIKFLYSLLRPGRIGIILPYELDKSKTDKISFKLSDKFDVPSQEVDASIFLPIPLTSHDMIKDMKTYLQFILLDKSSERSFTDGKNLVMKPKDSTDFAQASIVQHYKGKYIRINKEGSDTKFVTKAESHSAAQYFYDSFTRTLSTDTVAQKVEFACDSTKIDIPKDHRLVDALYAYVALNKLGQTKLSQEQKDKYAGDLSFHSGDISYKIKSINTTEDLFTHKITHTVVLEKVSSYVPQEEVARSIFLPLKFPLGTMQDIKTYLEFIELGKVPTIDFSGDQFIMKPTTSNNVADASFVMYKDGKYIRINMGDDVNSYFLNYFLKSAVKSGKALRFTFNGEAVDLGDSTVQFLKALYAYVALNQLYQTALTEEQKAKYAADLEFDLKDERYKIGSVKEPENGISSTMRTVVLEKVSSYVPQAEVERSIFLPLSFLSDNTIRDMRTLLAFIILGNMPEQYFRNGDELIMKPKDSTDFAQASFVRYDRGKYAHIEKGNNSAQFTHQAELGNVLNYFENYFAKALSTDNTLEKFEFTCNNFPVNISGNESVLVEALYAFIGLDMLKNKPNDGPKLGQTSVLHEASKFKLGNENYKIKSVDTKPKDSAHPIIHKVVLEKI